MKPEDIKINTGEQKIEVLPVEPSVKDMIDKILEQNKMILEQNAQLVTMLTHPMIYMIQK